MLKLVFVRYLHSADKNPAKIRNIGKDFPRKLDFKSKLRKLVTFAKLRKNVEKKSVYGKILLRDMLIYYF